MGSMSDRFGRRKTILIVATLVFSSCPRCCPASRRPSWRCWRARMLMGVAEGGIMPITQTLIAADVAPERRGLAQGITLELGRQPAGQQPRAHHRGLAMALRTYGWRHAFMIVAAIPGFVMALVHGAAACASRTHLDKHPETHAGADALSLLVIAPSWCAACCPSLLVAYLVVLRSLHALLPDEGASGIRPPSQWAGSWPAWASRRSPSPSSCRGCPIGMGRKPVAIVAALLGVGHAAGRHVGRGAALHRHLLSRYSPPAPRSPACSRWRWPPSLPR